MARLDLTALAQWITAAAVTHPNRLDHALAARCGVTRRTAQCALARLADMNWLSIDGDARHRAYRPGLLRQVVQRYALAGLGEDAPWANDFAPYFTFPAAVNRMMQYSFCELVNNAIDHSGGSQVTVSLRQTASQAQLLVSDDGRGLFSRIAETFATAAPRLAMLELSKGKLTSLPQRHSGQGLFFTSKLADVFDLHANEVAFQQRGWDGRGWRTQHALKREGTSIYAAIALDTARTLESVRKAYSLDGFGVGFERTVVPLRLITSDVAGLESRAQARRVGARLNEVRRAELDFNGVPDVGHAFADELFRVLAREQPALEMVAVNMSSAVAAMLASVRACA